MNQSAGTQLILPWIGNLSGAAAILGAKHAYAGALETLKNSTRNRTTPDILPSMNYTDELIFDSVRVRILLLVIYTIIFALCFFGNLVVVLVVTLHWSMRSITKFFLGNLAFANLCVGVFCIYQNLSTYLMDSWLFGDFLCKMYHFTNNLSHTASILILVVICVERYLVLLYPFRYRRILSIQRLRIIILLVWGVSALLCAPRLYYITTIEMPLGNGGKSEIICTLKRSIYDSETADMIYFVVLFILPLLIITVLYTKIGLFLQESERMSRTMNPIQKERRRGEKQFDSDYGNCSLQEIPLRRCSSSRRSKSRGYSNNNNNSSSSKNKRQHYYLESEISCGGMTTSTSGFVYYDDSQIDLKTALPISDVIVSQKLDSGPTWQVQYRTTRTNKEMKRKTRDEKGNSNKYKRKEQSRWRSKAKDYCPNCCLKYGLSKERHGTQGRHKGSKTCFHSKSGITLNGSLRSLSRMSHRSVVIIKNLAFVEDEVEEDPADDNTTILSIPCPPDPITMASNPDPSCCTTTPSHTSHYQEFRRRSSSRSSSSIRTNGSINRRASCSLRCSSHHRTRKSHQGGWAPRTKPKLTRVKSAKAMNKKLVVRMLIIIVVTFAICNLPYHVRKLCQNYMEDYEFHTDYSHMMTAITHLLMYTNCAINPIIYAFMSKPFRVSFRDLLRCQWRKNSCRKKRPSFFT